MHFVKLLGVIICVLSICTIAASQKACPSSGIACYPGDCCGQYQQCVGSTFYPIQNTAPGTVCKAGQLVLPSQCTTPCPSSSSATVTPTQRPPSQATEKPTPATQKPTTPPTQAPTQKPITITPTQPATQKPTTPPTQPATQKPITPTTPPTQPATQKPTQAPSNGKCSLADVFTQADYNALFPHANGAAIRGDVNQHAIFNYTYLINAAKRFPNFACTGDTTTRKREVAAFLAHTSQETSGWWSGQPYNWGFFFSTEVGCTNPTCTMYCDRSSSQYPCAPNKGYFGRGPIQLSWNYNYGQISQYLYGNDVLLQNPDMVFDEAGTGFATAIWFWMTSQGAKPSCHDVMTDQWVPSAADISVGRKPGFGMTTNIINGGIECGHATPPQVANRIGYFNTYTRYMGVNPGDNLECANMHSF